MKCRAFSFLLCACILLSLCPVLSLPTAAQAEAIDVSDIFDAETYTDGSAILPYRMYLPEDYDPNGSYPLILFFHGAGERGNDNTKQLKNAIGQMFASPDSPVYDCIVVAPQCPSGKQWVNVPNWGSCQYSSDEIAESDELKLVLKLLDHLKEQYALDSDRIYAAGLSMGGYATWDLLVRHTDLFAAGIPVCGGADWRKAERLTDVPIYTFHGLQDPTVPYHGTEKMVEAIQDAGGEQITYVTYPNGNHFIWEDAFSTEGLYDWLLSKRLSDRTAEDGGKETQTESMVPDTETESTGKQTAPADTERAPTQTEAEPTDTEEVPSDTEAEPSDTEVAPSDTEAEPSDTEAEPSDTGAEPSDTEAEPSDTEAEPTDTETTPPETNARQKEPFPPFTVLVGLLVGVCVAGVAIRIILFLMRKHKK